MSASKLGVWPSCRSSAASPSEPRGPTRPTVRSRPDDVGSDRAAARQHVDQRVEVGTPGKHQPRAGAERRVRQRDRRVRDAGSGVAGDLAGDDAHQRAAVRRRQQLRLAGADVLISGRVPLLLGRQVDPQLDAVEQPARHHQVLGRRLDVQDARARRHPLRVAVGDDAAAAVRVLVLEDAVDDVRDGLEPPVRMPGRALRLARRVVDLAHLVHVHERVDVVEAHAAAEGPADGEALALEASRRGRDRLDGPLRDHRGVRLGDPGQGQDVFHGYGRHLTSPSAGELPG